jgi:RNA recognition motif-containing protein
MPSWRWPAADEAARAIKELNGFNLNGRSIVVNEARSRGDGPGERPGKPRRK